MSNFCVLPIHEIQRMSQDQHVSASLAQASSLERKSEKTSLLNLPIEVLGHIIRYLVPSDEIFRISEGSVNPLKYESLEQSLKNHRRLYVKHGFKAHPTQCYLLNMRLNLKSSRQLDPVSFLPFPSDFPVYSLLSTCSVFHNLTCQRLYSTNVFSFSRPHLVFCFSQRLMPRTRDLIRFVHVDVCGNVTFQHPQHAPNYATSFYNYGFAHSIDPSITDVPAYFPNLWELRLGGIGPGVMHLDRTTGEIRREEVQHEWHRTSIATLAGILRLKFNHDSSVSVPLFTAHMKNPLASGRVFPGGCLYADHTFEEPWDTVPPEDIPCHGALQARGTRIFSPAVTDALIQELVGDDWKTLEINVQDLVDESDRIERLRRLEQRQQNQRFLERQARIQRQRDREREMRSTGEKVRERAQDAAVSCLWVCLCAPKPKCVIL